MPQLRSQIASAVFLIFTTLPALAEKQAIDYWRDIDLNLSDVEELIANNNCYSQTEIFVGCVAVVNELLLLEEPFRYFESGWSEDGDLVQAKFTVYPQELTEFLRRQKSELLGEEVAPSQTDEEVQALVEAARRFEALRTSVLESWQGAAPVLHEERRSVYNFSLAMPGALSSLREKVAGQEGQPSRQPEISLRLLQAYMTWAFDGHAGVEPLEHSRSLIEQESQSFFGIGAEVSLESQFTIIRRVLPGSPSEKAGILPGDLIIEIQRPEDEEPLSIQGWGIERVVSHMKGPEGSVVRMKVRRAGEILSELIPITRGQIETNNVESSVIAERFGYIRMLSFTRGADEEIEEALKDFEARDLAGTILDLRNNGGGLVPTAVNIASLLLEDGKEIVSFQKYSHYGEDSRYVSGQRADRRHSGFKYTKPLVVLIDSGSASASELVSGALRDHERAYLVGVPSFGKGTQQSSFPLARLQFFVEHSLPPSSESFLESEREALFLQRAFSFPFTQRLNSEDEQVRVEAASEIALKVTTARFHQPNGESNHLVGIHPHFLRYTQPEGPSEREHNALREEDLVPNVPEAFGEAVTPEVDDMLADCVVADQSAEEAYAATENKHAVDYQLDSAIEVIRCLVGE